MLACQRHLFQLPDGSHYLNCAYMSPMLATVKAAGLEGMRRKRNPAAIVPADFFEELARVRSLAAGLLGERDSSRVAIVPSVSYGLATVARNLPTRSGGTVMMAAEQFPSNVYIWQRLARERGLDLRVVAVTGREDPTATVIEAIDERTAVVAVGAVHWVDGTRVDLVRVGAAARAVGAALVIDGTQSVGAVPFDVATVRPAAVIAAGYKWLLGSYSLGLGWLGPELDGGVPLEETWIARPDSDDFAGLVQYRDGYRPGAARYDVGEASNFVLMPMLRAALEQLGAWGVEQVAEYCGVLTARLVAAAERLGLAVTPAPARSPHIVGIRLPDEAVRRRVADACKARGVSVSFRGNAVRVSPNVYNDLDDVDVFVEVLSGAR